jgi:hypothetical protein
LALKLQGLERSSASISSRQDGSKCCSIKKRPRSEATRPVFQRPMVHGSDLLIRPKQCCSLKPGSLSAKAVVPTTNSEPSDPILLGTEVRIAYRPKSGLAHVSLSSCPIVRIADYGSRRARGPRWLRCATRVLAEEYAALRPGGCPRGTQAASMTASPRPSCTASVR